MCSRWTVKSRAFHAASRAVRIKEQIHHRSLKLNRSTAQFVFLACSSVLCGSDEVTPRDVESLLMPTLQRSEIIGLVAGFGTTFAAFPDLLAMLRKRAPANMRPRMAAIMGTFQILWVYYGLLIGSRLVVAWNMIAVIINFLNVGAYFYFMRQERRQLSLVTGSAGEADR